MTDDALIRSLLADIMKLADYSQREVAKSEGREGFDRLVLRDDVLELYRKVAAVLDRPAPPLWSCTARAHTDPPQDCNWPHCQCDPYADKVIAALIEEQACFSASHAERDAESRPAWNDDLDACRQILALDMSVDSDSLPDPIRPIPIGTVAHSLYAAIQELRSLRSVAMQAMSEVVGLHRCKSCGTHWLLWPNSVYGGGWNLLDKYQRPGPCCDNERMKDQIEHLRDIPLQMP